MIVVVGSSKITTFYSTLAQLEELREAERMGLFHAMTVWTHFGFKGSSTCTVMRFALNILGQSWKQLDETCRTVAVSIDFEFSF